jgi:hypothetical protein
MRQLCKEHDIASLQLKLFVSPCYDKRKGDTTVQQNVFAKGKIST